MELAYGIKKLAIICVIEDDKISVEDLREEIEEFEDLVCSLFPLVYCVCVFARVVLLLLTQEDPAAFQFQDPVKAAVSFPVSLCTILLVSCS